MEANSFILTALPNGEHTLRGVAMMNRLFGLLLLGLALSSASTLDPAGGQFKKAVYYGAGRRPYQVITGHFTSSGHLDLAFADWQSDQICILLGNGDGSFQKQRCFAVGAPISLASGDFNEDGNEDLAVVETAQTGNGSIALFMGDGIGHFKLSAKYTTGVVPLSVALADFNGDGHLDAAIADEGINNPGDVKVFFGDGKGHLGKARRYKVGGGPYAVAAGDLNGDHFPDLAVANRYGYVSVLLNDDTGHFRNRSYDGGGTSVSDVKIVNLRNNGKQDLIAANPVQGLVVLLNRGDGTFRGPKYYRPCQNCAAPVACVSADFNADKKPDVACATEYGDSYLYYGDGKGQFGPAIPMKEEIGNDGGYSIAAGDFNNDKAPDLAIPIQNYGKVAILINAQ